MDLYSKLALKITTKSGDLTTLTLNAAQTIVEAKINEQLERSGRVRCLILKARQEGMSTYVAGRIYRGCTLWGHRRGLVLADKIERAGEIFGIYERFEREAPLELRPPKHSGRRSREMAWTTDSRVSVETAGDAEAGRGYTVQYLHASEQAMWEHAEETWTAVMQSVPISGGEVYVESTAKGVGNLFHRLWVQAETGQSDWVAIFLPWFIHEEYQVEATPEETEDILGSSDPFERQAQDTGIEFEQELMKLTPDQLAWRRRKIRDDFVGSERTFRQEFPATAEEAFLVSGHAFFDDDALIEARRNAVPPMTQGQLRMNGRKQITYLPAERGWLKIWEMPRPDCHYVIGADTAAGKLVNIKHDADSVTSEAGGRDFSCADVIATCQLVEGRWERCERQVAQFHGRIVPELFAEGLFALGNFYASASRFGLARPALLAVERNHASGQTVLRELRENWRYQTLYYNRRFNTRMRKATEFLGWVTDSASRQPMLDAFASSLREGTLQINSPDTVREMHTFVRNDLGHPESQEGTHDDRVISMAIALEMTRWHTHDPVGEVPEWVGAQTVTRM
jgi:hypothetical protein